MRKREKGEETGDKCNRMEGENDGGRERKRRQIKREGERGRETEKVGGKERKR